MNLGDLFDARAFALGMLALVNPCGFALLPAYLGYFLGMNDDDEQEPRIVTLNRAQVVGLSMSVGFLAVFGILGLAFASFIFTIADFLPWVTVVIGIGLAILGVAMAAGFKPMVSLPKLEKGTGSRSVFSMFLFGVSYALASLTCTIGIFLSAVAGSSIIGGVEIEPTFTDRFGGFVSYAVGMGLMATGLTLAVAFGRKGVVTGFRRILPHINMISAVVLIIIGLYVAWYGYWSTDPINIRGGLVLWVEARQANVSNWIDGEIIIPGVNWVVRRSTILGVGFLVVNVGLAIAGLVARQTNKPHQDTYTDYEPERV